MYYEIARRSMIALRCDVVPGLDGLFLVVEQKQLCFQDAAHGLTAGVAIVALLLAIFIPCFLLWKIRKPADSDDATVINK